MILGRTGYAADSQGRDRKGATPAGRSGAKASESGALRPSTDAATRDARGHAVQCGSLSRRAQGVSQPLCEDTATPIEARTTSTRCVGRAGPKLPRRKTWGIRGRERQRELHDPFLGTLRGSRGAARCRKHRDGGSLRRNTPKEEAPTGALRRASEIGRASCRERV